MSFQVRVIFFTVKVFFSQKIIIGKKNLFKNILIFYFGFKKNLLMIFTIFPKMIPHCVQGYGRECNYIKRIAHVC